MMMLFSFIAKAFILTACVLVAICGLLFFFQDRLLFFPKTPVGYENPSQNPPGMRHPGEYRIPYQDLRISSVDDDVVLHAWLMKQTNNPETRPTLIFFQGNAGNMGFRLPNLVDLYRALGCNIIAPSYRGYGDSTGRPSEAGLKADVKTVLEYILAHAEELQIDTTQIVAFGRSLGGAAAIYLAHSYPTYINGLILENTFLSIKEMAKIVFPPLRRLEWLLELLIRLNFNSDELVKDLTMPLLLIAGQEDTLVPPAHMEGLFRLAENSKMRWMARVEGGSHNDTWQTCPKEYYQLLQRFMEEAMALARNATSTTKSVKEFRLNVQEPLSTESKSSEALTESLTKASSLGVKLRNPRFYEVMPRQVAQ